MVVDTKVLRIDGINNKLGEYLMKVSEHIICMTGISAKQVIANYKKIQGDKYNKIYRMCYVEGHMH